MDKANVKVKKWGNSFGIILPRDIVNSQNIQEGIEIEISVQAKDKTRVKNIFGILKRKFGKNTEELMKETDKELWGIEK
jgi:antitoxin component of MazEF toxin-antitoxin module